MWLFKFNHLKDFTPVSSQLGEKFTLLQYNQDIIDLFNLVGIHMYIIYNRWLYVVLFKFQAYYPCISSQLGEKFTLVCYNLFNWFGIHMYTVYNRWLYVWLFKFNDLNDITPVYHHNLVRNVHCYVTTRTSSTFSIYLWAMYIVYNRWLYVWLFKFNHWKDIFLVLIYHHNLAKNVHCYVTTRTSLTFSIYLGAVYIVCNRWLCVWLTVCSSLII